MSEHFDGESRFGSFDAALTVPEARLRRTSSPGLIGRLAKARLIAALPALAVGRLTVHLPDGTVHGGGDPGSSLHATLWIDDEAFFDAFASRGDIGVGESWMAGHFRTDDLVALLEIGIRNEAALPQVTWLTRLLNLGNDLQHRLRPNTRAGSRRNIHAHYDLSNALFSLFLDPAMVYSSAYYERADDTLAQAQQRKFRRLAEAVGLRAGAHVLEIGCGWGGFAIFAARTYGCRVTGITVSEEQFELATARVREAGLQDLVDIRFCDYRDVAGQYSHIVSIEMLEAVGREHWSTFFEVCHARLAPGGALAIQTIGMPDHRFEVYARHADWIQKYIFPGGMLPSLGAMIEAASGTTPLTLRWVDDIAPHYARTLREWRARFLDRLDEVHALGFDDRFVRMWEYYLASCEAMFKTRQISTLQLVMARAGE
ncbi:cyclopropane-fatty-acyl-phospholipid synthase [Luteitalea sp. TBR-22]|uniref:SAM-dependent methyltransferase n=1 Tax=Luteitalea sp. TBR-22 TaxID=2802971 RepID=UPI001AF1BFFD|nr:cyclopropane-fatty-acyl-phospholipid synthase family protein [Luteitalea sp. TBR-22]BCS34355.1 cyclopropane-fatty-acyl-phospholipid synthase [Luteitalea sp. TBR-22]